MGILNDIFAPPDDDPMYGKFAKQSLQNFAGGVPRFIAGLGDAFGNNPSVRDIAQQHYDALATPQLKRYNAAHGVDPVAQTVLAMQQEKQGGGQGGGGGRKQMGGEKHPILRYIQRQNPGMSLKEARKIRNDYSLEQQAPGLADFARQQTGQPDPNTMQMFFAKTVQPYLQQTANQFNAGAQAGTQAMRSILSGAEASGGGSPAIDVLKQWLPVQQAGQMQQGAALDAATRTAPMYDALLNQLNENIQQQQRTQYYQQALAAGGGAAQQNPNDIGASVVSGAAAAAAK